MKQGVTRLVFPVGRYVIKIPNFLVQHDHFLMGCAANWKERTYWKLLKTCPDTPQGKLIAPSCFCSWFGLVQIQRRVTVRSCNHPLSVEEVRRFKDITTDIKPTNFGYYNGRLVCLDYAQ